MSEMPSKWEILKYWAYTDDRLGFIDQGEPRCFACRKQYPGLEGTDYYTLTAEEKYKVTTEYCAQVWEATPLQRCHLKARQFGGANEVGNLVLMCAECHDLAPDVPDPKFMLDWMRRQNHVERFMAQLQAAWTSLGLVWDVNEASLFLWNHHAPHSAFNQWCAKKHVVGVHGTQTGTFRWMTKLTSHISAWTQFRDAGGHVLSVTFDP